MPWISSFRKSIPKLLGYANPIDSWTVKLSKWTKTFVTVQIVTIPLGWAVPIYLVISHIKLFPSSPVRLLLSITSWFTEDKINYVSTVIVTTVQKKNYKEKLNMKLLMDSPPTCPWNAELAKVNPHFIPLQTQQIPTRVALTALFQYVPGLGSHLPTRLHLSKVQRLKVSRSLSIIPLWRISTPQQKNESKVACYWGKTSTTASPVHCVSGIQI